MRRPWIILLGITLLGLALRLFILSQRGSLWFDEAFSVHFASMDLGRMFSYLRHENNPPFYFILLHFWMKLFGASELAVRALSMVFGLASIPLIYLIGRRLHSTTSGLFAAFLAAISSFQIIYSTETRMYALYLFLALCTVWLFLKNQEAVIKRQESGIMNHESWVGLFFNSLIPYLLFIILALLVWTHITAWLIVLTLILYLLWQQKFNIKQTIIRNSSFMILTVLVALSFLPWGARFFTEKIATPISQGWFFYLPPGRNFFLDILESFLAFSETNAFIVTLLSVVMAVLLWYAVRDIRRSDLRRAGDPISSYVMFLSCWLFVPLVIGFAFSNAVPRYFIAASPALYLLLGIGFARYTEAEPPKLRRLGFLFPIVVFALILPSTVALPQLAHHRWDKLASWIMEHETHNNTKNAPCSMLHAPCLILINPHSEILPFERYYKGTLPVVGFYPRKDTDDRDTRIVKTNWISIVTNENVPRLRDITFGFDRVFLVQGEVDTTEARALVPLWFWENDWRRGSAQSFNKIGVTLLERSKSD